MLLCNDLDLVLFEPTLARDCLPLATVVWQGTVSISGTMATVASGSTPDAPPAEPGMLAFFPATKTTALFVRRDSSTALSLCALTAAIGNDNFPDDLALHAGPGDSGNVSMQLLTFAQRRPASQWVLDALGLGVPAGGTLVAPEALTSLRRAAACLALASIVRSMAAIDRTVVASGNAALRYNEEWRLLAGHYDRRAAREIARARPGVGFGGQNVAELNLDSAAPVLLRS